MVGDVGQAGERFGASTASAAQLAPLDLVIAGGSAVKAIGVWPAEVEFTARRGAGERHHRQIEAEARA